MPSAVVEHIEFSTVLRGDENFIFGKPGQSRTYLAYTLVEPIGDKQAAIRPERHCHWPIQFRLRGRAAIARKTRNARPSDCRNDTFRIYKSHAQVALVRYIICVIRSKDD